ncbi:DsrE family protein [Stakelama marina]|uniref:DsrE family protein n=1 Tax=Stakelama marina TaxID=2826939 RepID=A0A8T4IIF1_9SPHN|nr:DsrE family protein [Stakelama marina]MBR0552089.1 DsrE family protein [Stakelama marina]
MRGLTIIVATSDHDRFHAALTLASAHAALGARTRIYCHGAAVELLQRGDGPHGPLVTTALETGVKLLACQTGLADANLSTDRLIPEVEMTGMVSLLAELADDRLVTV